MKFKKLDPLIEELLGIRIVPWDTTQFLYEARNTVTTIENNIIQQLQSNRRLDLRGLDLNTSEDVAILGKMCRDMRYETVRFIYLKDGEIVGSNTTTTGLPDESVAFLKFNNSDNVSQSAVKTFHFINSRIEKLDADGVCILHNHPSGNAVFSKQDYAAAEVWKKYVPLIDFIVVGHNEIRSMLHDKVFTFDNIKTLSKSSEVKSPRSILDNVYQYLKSPDYSLLIYVDSKGHILVVDEIKNTEFNDAETMWRYLSNRKKELGVPSLFVVTESEDIIGNASVIEMFMHNLFRDVIKYDKNSNNYESLFGSKVSARDSSYNSLGKKTSIKSTVKG